MKVKAVIMRPDRTNDVVVVKKKNIRGKTFDYGENQYFLHPDRFQVTWTRNIFGFKRYYSTYYFKQGMSQPLPIPDFPEVHFEDMEACACEGPTHEPDCEGPAFVGLADNGVSGEELAAIFNPWFYRIIGQIGMDKWAQIQFYCVIGAALGVAYLIYLVNGLQGEISALSDQLAQYQGNQPASVSTPPPPPTSVGGGTITVGDPGQGAAP